MRTQDGALDSGFKVNLFSTLSDTSVRANHAGAGGDLLSVLLNKGNKLREEMIISALDSKAKTQEVKAANETDTEPKQIYEPVEIDEPNLSMR